MKLPIFCEAFAYKCPLQICAHLLSLTHIFSLRNNWSDSKFGASSSDNNSEMIHLTLIRKGCWLQRFHQRVHVLGQWEGAALNNHCQTRSLSRNQSFSRMSFTIIRVVFFQFKVVLMLFLEIHLFSHHVVTYTLLWGRNHGVLSYWAKEIVTRSTNFWVHTFQFKVLVARSCLLKLRGLLNSRTGPAMIGVDALTFHLKLATLPLFVSIVKEGLARIIFI